MPRPNPHFTGREHLISQVRDGLLGSQTAVVQALHGMGGVGKTQVALEYAHRFASQYDIVWWIDAEQADQVPIHYNELATRIGLAKPEAGTEHNTRALLQHLRGQDRWLIILDNADDPSAFTSLLPTGPGHVLITSRNPGWRENVRSHDLGVFPRSDSMAYLTVRFPGIAPEQADALADGLGDLPLALAQAAGVITNGMTPGRYLYLLTEKTAKLMATGSPPGYPTSLAAAVDIATTRLAADHPQAADVLRLGAFLGPDPIPTAWLEVARDRLATLSVGPDDFMWPQSALKSLARYGLARVDHETFQIHRLTQAVLRDHTTAADTNVTEDDVTALLTAVTPGAPDTPAVWPGWAALASHLTACRHIATHRPRLRESLLHASLYLIGSGQARAARDLTISLHPGWAASLGEDHPDTLAIAQYLGHATADLGEYAAACRMDEDTLERRRRVLGEDHPDTLNSANDLAAVLERLGEYSDSRRMFEDTLERRRRVLGEDHPDTLNSANNLAATLELLGEYADSRRMIEDILERRRRVLGEDHPDTLQSANNLAVILDRLGEYADSRRMDEDTLERRRRVLGEDHPDTHISANNLASALTRLGEFAAARRMDEDTLQRRRRVLGEDHPDTLNSASNLAIILDRLGEYAAARRMDEDTLERRRRVLGEDHPDTHISANNLAGTLTRLGEHAEARRVIEDILERRRRVLGEDHPDTLNSAHDLALTLHRLGQSAVAARLLKETRARSRRALGDGHPFTRKTTENLVRLLTAAGKLHEAHKLMASGKAGQPRNRQKRR